MKNSGRLVLLILSILMSIIYSIIGHVFNSLFVILAIIHMCISWVIGRRYDTFKFLSYHDPLTGVYNRRYAYENFDKKFNKARSKHKNIGLLNIDIDNFKDVNDTYGHHYGDFILKELSRIVLRNIHKDDLLVRWGGDEFLVLYLNRNEKSARDLIYRLNQMVKGEVCSCKEEVKLDLSLSIGLSIFPQDGENLSELLSVADKRMYNMKSLTK